MKRLMIITDSLGAPRTEPEVCCYDDTWPCKVKKDVEKKGYDVVIHTVNGLDSNHLVVLAKDKLKLYKPSIIIYQFGIVDCAPRVFTEKEKLIFRIFYLHKIMAFLGKKYHATLSKLRNSTVTDEKRFENNLKIIKEVMHSSIGSFFVPIGLPCIGYTRISPRINNKIERFNNIFKHNVEFLFEGLKESEVEKIYMNDHHHLNKYGHDKLYLSVMEELSDFL